MIDLFPTPLLRARRVLNDEVVAGLVKHFTPAAVQANARSEHLSHTRMVAPSENALLEEASRVIEPHLIEFGEHLFGERLTWLIKEMWVNVLETGGYQTRHNHANSFVSGVIYLTTCHPSSNTVFLKAPGGMDYVFNNANARSKLGPYNAGKWISPDPTPGDLLLFPSYLLHEVPVNAGSRRITLAFNAIPSRLESWGYTLTLAP
jgi:uncharacterized protein (TIGR02466 family)